MKNPGFCFLPLAVLISVLMSFSASAEQDRDENRFSYGYNNGQVNLPPAGVCSVGNHSDKDSCEQVSGTWTAWSTGLVRPRTHDPYTKDVIKIDVNARVAGCDNLDDIDDTPMVSEAAIFADSLLEVGRNWDNLTEEEKTNWSWGASSSSFGTHNGNLSPSGCVQGSGGAYTFIDTSATPADSSDSATGGIYMYTTAGDVDAGGNAAFIQGFDNGGEADIYDLDDGLCYQPNSDIEDDCTDAGEKWLKTVFDFDISMADDFCGTTVNLTDPSDKDECLDGDNADDGVWYVDRYTNAYVSNQYVNFNFPWRQQEAPLLPFKRADNAADGYSRAGGAMINTLQSVEALKAEYVRGNPTVSRPIFIVDFINNTCEAEKVLRRDLGEVLPMCKVTYDFKVAIVDTRVGGSSVASAGATWYIDPVQTEDPRYNVGAGVDANYAFNDLPEQVGGPGVVYFKGYKQSLNFYPQKVDIWTNINGAWHAADSENASVVLPVSGTDPIIDREAFDMHVSFYQLIKAAIVGVAYRRCEDGVSSFCNIDNQIPTVNEFINDDLWSQWKLDHPELVNWMNFEYSGNDDAVDHDGNGSPDDNGKTDPAPTWDDPDFWTMAGIRYYHEIHHEYIEETCSNGDCVIDDLDGDGVTDVGASYVGSSLHRAEIARAELAWENYDGADTDGDGLSNYFETLIAFTDPVDMDGDTDNDGINDFMEVLYSDGNPNDGTDGNLDTDADNLGNASDNCPLVSNAAQTDTDADDLGNACDIDDDNDGWLDVDEASCGTNPLSDTSIPPDHDDDGTCDLVDTDDDNDGWLDVDELTCNSDSLDESSIPLDTDSDGLCNATDTDDDGDDLSDDNEINIHGTDPLLKNTDADDVLIAIDGSLLLSTEDACATLTLYSLDFHDGLEVTYGFDPIDPDADDDGLDDIDEMFLEFIPGSGYHFCGMGTETNTDTSDDSSDSDGDGLLDGEEVYQARSNPSANNEKIIGGNSICDTAVQATQGPDTIDDSNRRALFNNGIGYIEGNPNHTCTTYGSFSSLRTPTDSDRVVLTWDLASVYSSPKIVRAIRMQARNAQADYSFPDLVEIKVSDTSNFSGNVINLGQHNFAAVSGPDQWGDWLPLPDYQRGYQHMRIEIISRHALGDTPGSNVKIREVEFLVESDADGDGMPDSWEDLHGLDRTENDTAGDPDNDTVSNIDEFLADTAPAGSWILEGSDTYKHMATHSGNEEAVEGNKRAICF